jgi:hypothetical protein
MPIPWLSRSARSTLSTHVRINSIIFAFVPLLTAAQAPSVLLSSSS